MIAPLPRSAAGITRRTAWPSVSIRKVSEVPYYIDVIMSVKSPASRLLTQPFIHGAGQRKHQSSESLAFVSGIHRWPVNSPHKGPVMRKLFPFDDVIIPLMIVSPIRKIFELSFKAPSDALENLENSRSAMSIAINLWYKTHQIPKFGMILVSYCSCLCPIHWTRC